MVTLKADDGMYMDTHVVAIRVTDEDEMTPEGSLLDRYDTNNNNEFDKNEVIAAIRDYLRDGDPSKVQVVEIIRQYLRG